MNFEFPPAFPKAEFQEFGKIAGTLFLAALSDEDLNDSCQRRLHFQNAWTAVCYRYRACAEQNVAFNCVFDNAMSSELWREWSEGDDYNYEIEQCLYGFFMNALSVLESFGFSLYFVGAAIDPRHFQNTSNPRNITLKKTYDAFELAFANSSLTAYLAAMLKDHGFTRIESIRNLLAHRLTGRRNIRSFGCTRPDGTHNERREEFWYIPGLNEEVFFDRQLLQLHLDDLTRLLVGLTSTSLEFVKLKQMLP